MVDAARERGRGIRPMLPMLPRLPRLPVLPKHPFPVAPRMELQGLLAPDDGGKKLLPLSSGTVIGVGRTCADKCLAEHPAPELTAELSMERTSDASLSAVRGLDMWCCCCCERVPLV